MVYEKIFSWTKLNSHANENLLKKKMEIVKIPNMLMEWCWLKRQVEKSRKHSPAGLAV